MEPAVLISIISVSVLLIFFCWLGLRRWARTKRVPFNETARDRALEELQLDQQRMIEKHKRTIEESKMLEKENKMKEERCMAIIGRLQKRLKKREVSSRSKEWSDCLRALGESGDAQKWQAASALREELGPKFAQDVVYQRHVAECEKSLRLTERAISSAEEEFRHDGASNISEYSLGELCEYMRGSLHALQALAGKMQAIGLLTPSDGKDLQGYAHQVERLEARCNELTRHLEDEDSPSSSQRLRRA